MVSFLDFLTVYSPKGCRQSSVSPGGRGPQGGSQTCLLHGPGLRAVSMFLQELIILEHSHLPSA